MATRFCLFWTPPEQQCGSIVEDPPPALYVDAHIISVHSTGGHYVGVHRVETKQRRACEARRCGASAPYGVGRSEVTRRFDEIVE